MNSTTYLTLDLQAPNFAVMASAKQNDTLGRQIAATLRDGSASFDATGLLCEIRYAKPDGTVGFYDTLEDDETPAYSIDGNVVTFTLAEQMLAVAGAVYVDLNFYAATGEKLTAFTFTLNVEASVLDDGTIVSSDYYNVLTATLAEAAEIAANLPEPSSATPIPDSSSGSAGTGNGFARGNHSHPLNVATSGTPANLGTAANGTSANYARQDHVHAMPSASDVGAADADDVQYKLYDSVTDLGLTSGSATIAGAWTAMPDASILICTASDFATSETPTSGSYLGTIEITKLDANRAFVQAFGKTDSAGDYRMFCDSATGSPSGTWFPASSAVLTTTPSISNGSYESTSYGIAKSGSIVTVGVITNNTAVTTSWATVGTIPTGYRPSREVSGIGLSGFTPIQVKILTTGDIQYRNTSALSANTTRFSLTWMI